MSKPFPFPEGYQQDLTHLILDKSIRDYIAIFEQRRAERPGGKLADVDSDEIMRLAEDLDEVDATESNCILQLTNNHPDYFSSEDQRQRLARFALTHIILSAARRDELVKDLVALVPITFFRGDSAREFIGKAQALSAAVKASEAFHDAHGDFDPALVQEVNAKAAQLRTLVEGLTLADVDKHGREAREAFFRDVFNLLVRPSGKADHEAKWDDGKWLNWNRDVTVYPEHYEQPRNRHEIIALLTQRQGPFRMVGGGHAFNISASMGGTKDHPIGTLATLDKYTLENGLLWEKVPAATAIAKYNLPADQAERVVRASAGIRLRDFGKEMWNAGFALPVAGSTDAQSIAGLIATDLHSTGKKVGFLSPQLLEVTVLNASGEPVTFTKDESVPRGTKGRFRWTPPGQTSPETLAWLPVAGALGTLGPVVEIVLKLDAKYNMRKLERFVPREWAEANIGRLLSLDETDLSFDHVSFYYAGGGGPALNTVRLNAWKRTTDELSKDGADFKTIREIFDLVGSGFFPDYLLRLSQKKVAVLGQTPGPDDDPLLTALNQRKPLVLPANEGFARKLFFQHDEIELGFPMPDVQVFRDAINDVQVLLQREEFKTIIEIRFTPDASEGMLGPGTGGKTCYIELASALGDYSKERIVQVYDLFDRMLREKYHARPHLGKKTSVTYADMANIYGPVWDEFQSIRSRMDPNNRFLPADNVFLNRIFRN